MHFNDIPKTKQKIYQRVVDAPFDNRFETTSLDLGIIVLLLVDHDAETIDRIALSNTDQALGALRMSEKKFHDIKIPLHHKTNVLSLALRTKKPQHTDDWHYMFTPELSAKAARFNQVGAGIACSFVYPFASGQGALIYSFFQPFVHIKTKHRKFMKEYTRIASDMIDKA